jgi:hypothetical protein
MPSKLGIHCVMPDGTMPTVRALLQAGAIMATVKAVGGMGVLQEVKAISPQTITVGRFLHGTEGFYMEVPNLEKDDLRAVAREMMDHILPVWDQHRAYVDYWEVINETDPTGAEGHRRLAELMIHLMDFAEPEGYKLGLFSYSLGVPEWDEFKAIVETGVFARARTGGHVLALHEYAKPMDKWYGEPLPGLPRYPDRGPLAFRYRWWYEDFLKPRNEVIPLLITEANIDEDVRPISNADWIRQLAWYDEGLRRDPYVLGAQLFTLGGGSGWAHFDFERMLPELIQHIVALKDTVDPTWAEYTGTLPPPILQPQGVVESHYLLLPPGSDRRWLAACAGYWEAFHVTIGTNLDEAVQGPQRPQAVTVVNPQQWPQDPATLVARLAPGIRYEPIKAATPEALAQLLDQRAMQGKRWG